MTDSGNDSIDARTLALLVCPVCFGALMAERARIACARCNRVYPVVDGIPVLIADRAGK